MSWQARQLHWVRNGNLAPLAPWAVYFLELGLRSAELPPPADRRTVASLVLPVADYSAVLFATGLVCRLANERMVHEPNPERFARLANLPVGHPVRVLRKGRLFNGHIADLPGERSDRSLPVTVSTSEHGSSHFLCTPENCMRMEPTDMASEADHEQRGLRIVDNPAFVSRVLEETPLENLCLGTRLDFALVGAQARLLAEAETALSLGNDGPRQGLVGTPSDLVRLRGGVRDYRGMIVPATVAQPRMPERPPRVVVFSGAAGFLRLRDRFLSSHHVVLLDRSEPRCSEAVNQLNRQFYQRAGDGDAGLIGAAPAGTEQLVFDEV